MTRNVLALGFVGLLASAVAGGEALADPPVRAEARLAWGNQAGWTYLGETRLAGWRDRAFVEIDRGLRRLDRIMLVASRGFADVRAVRVHLAGGESFVAHVGNFNGRAVVDLPDRGRVSGIELLGGGRGGRRNGARIQIFGDLRERGQYGNGYGNGNYNDHGIGGGGAGHQPAYEQQTSWQPLGSAFVDGRRDRETIVVGRDEGRFRQLMLSTNTDIGIHNVTVTFLNGETVTLPLRAAVGGNGMVFDLPGDARGIREVSFSASQRGPGMNARVDLLAI